MAKLYGLPPRELEILQLVFSGSTNKGIAAEIHIREKRLNFILITFTQKLVSAPGGLQYLGYPARSGGGIQPSPYLKHHRELANVSRTYVRAHRLEAQRQNFGGKFCGSRAELGLEAPNRLREQTISRLPSYAWDRVSRSPG